MNEEIFDSQHIIDCHANPHIPEGWQVREEDQLPGRVCGQLIWDSSKVVMRMYSNRLGEEFRGELANEPVLNANVLHYLFRNQHFIPENWKHAFNYFWGTIFLDSDGRLCVGCLNFWGGGWTWHYEYLDEYWLGDIVVLLLAQ